MDPHFRPLAGFVLMAIASAIAWRFGDRVLRWASAIIGTCWTAAILAQLLTGLQAEPVIAADVVCAAALLVLASRAWRVWLCALVMLGAALLILHASLYEAWLPASALEVWCNNLLSLAVLAVLAGAALVEQTKSRQVQARGMES